MSVHPIYLILLLLVVITTCRLPERPAAPITVTFDAPKTEIVGGRRLEPPEPQWDGYGEAVDVYKDVMAIGASEWNPCGHGSVYVYRASEGTWLAEAQLVAGDRDDFIKQAGQFEGQRFGTSVAVGEATIAVGAPGNILPAAGGQPGAVYLYEYDGRTWVETARLSPEAAAQGRSPSRATPSVCGRMRPGAFGALLALHNDTLAVGGDGDGLVYLYGRSENGWREQARVSLPGRPGRELYLADMDLYGDTLSLSALYLLPQAEASQDFLSGSVVVYVFERAGDTWQESFRFAPEADSDLLFFREINAGASVALTGEGARAGKMAVGLPGFPDWSAVQQRMVLFGVSSEEVPEFPASNRRTGSVYLLERGQDGRWQQGATLRPAGWENLPDPASGFSGNPPAAGQAQSHPEGGGLLAAASLGSFVFPGHIYSAAPEISFFGATVDLDGNQLAVTAGFANATYVFTRQGADWIYAYQLKPGREVMEFVEDYAQVVRMDGRTLLLGTPGEFGNSAYVFILPSQ